MIPLVKTAIGKEEIASVTKVMESGMLAQGETVAEFERKFSELCGCRHTVAVNSGTAALHAALYAIGVGPGDEVITTPFTFVATANSILMQNAKVVFADISRETFNIDPAEIEKKITPKTKAIIAVDLFGQLADYDRIGKIAKKHKILVVEDAAQSVGASEGGKSAGNIADIAAFSLYATKNLMCGEGGAVTTNNEEYMERAKMLRHHGQSEKTRYQYFDLGYNYRLTNIAAAIALEQMKKLPGFNESRRKNAQYYFKALKGVDGLVLPYVKPKTTHVFHQFTVLVPKEKRERLMASLKEKGIGSSIFYPKPLHLHPHFAKMGFKEGDFPVAEEIAGRCLSIPVHPLLTEEEAREVALAIKEGMR